MEHSINQERCNRPGNTKTTHWSNISIRLKQVHEKATRENNILDLVFTTNPSLVKTSTNIPGISDHAIIITDTEIKPHYHKSTPRKVYIWPKANWEDINKDLDNLVDIIRSKIQNKESVNEICLSFKQHLFDSLDNHIPSKQVKSNNRLPWINHKIRKMLKKKQNLYNQAKKSKKMGKLPPLSKNMQKRNNKGRMGL